MTAQAVPYVLTGVLPTLPCKLPSTSIEEEVNAEEIGTQLLQSLSGLSLANLTPDAVWRDMFALTGTLRSFYGHESVRKAWNDTYSSRHATAFTVVPRYGKVVRLPKGGAWIEVMFTFRCDATPATLCAGYLNLVPDSKGGWQIWLIRTVLEGLDGSPDVNTLQPVSSLSAQEANGVNGHATGPNGVNGNIFSNGSINGTSVNGSSAHFDCVVVGAGQAGLGTAGRLKALGVSYVVIEKYPQVGDNWIKRYESARLHTPREYNHLPFDRTFSLPYQEFLDRKDLAKGYQDWTKKFDIDKDIWCSTSLETGTWDEAQELWTLCIKREGTPQTITCRHVVLAVGGGGQSPMMPSYLGREQYKGTILHSADYTTPEAWRGKAGIVIGTANTGHDVAEDMVDAGLSSVTMVQRGRTFVLPVEYLMQLTVRNYNLNVPVETADRQTMTMPYGISRILGSKVMHAMAAAQPERFDALEKVGFKVERFGDLTWQIGEKFGGHYIDVGCSAKIAKGLIKMKSDALPTHYTATGLAFNDGTTVDADVIVFATGFVGNMRTSVRDFFGDQVADQVDDFWTFDEEGELKGAFKPTGHAGLWYMGGTVPQARYYSRHVALQIKAAVMGTPLPLYTGERRRKQERL